MGQLEDLHTIVLAMAHAAVQYAGQALAGCARLRTVRIVAWNCCQKFTTNVGHLLELDFDVAVVTESTPMEPLVTDGRGLTTLFKAPAPPSPKCIGVLARAPWSISALPSPVPDLPWPLPAAVTGPVDFTLLAVWPVTFAGAPSYTAQLAQVLDGSFPGDGSPVVLAGDLNSPIAATIGAHLHNVGRLAALGLRSSFLSSRGVSAADAHLATGRAAAEPTYYQHRRRENGFHIDHIFVPEGWRIESLAVGSYDDWVATGRSDHVPLIADVAVC